VSTANNPLYIAQLSDLKSASDPPFFIELLAFSTHLASVRSHSMITTDSSFAFKFLRTSSVIAKRVRRAKEKAGISFLVEKRH
jgi:hypothetical protein